MTLDPKSIKHAPSCRADYPEKPAGEAPQAVTEQDLDDGYRALVCVDCGAQVNDLPPLEDGYWDDVREELRA